MHPQVVKSAPGDCPICGMTLVKKTVTVKKPAAKPAPAKKPQPAAAPKKALTVKKNVVQKPKAVPKAVAKPNPVVKKPAPPRPKAVSKEPEPATVKTPEPASADLHKKQNIAEQFTCPMHPEVISDQPGKCPKCGMNLVPKKDSEEDHSVHENAQKEGVHKMIMPVPAKNLKGGRKVTYHLYVKDTLVNFAGKQKRAIAVNGQIPMPELVFYEGDTAEVVVHNLMDEETSLHWHGLHLPNKEDGVPWLTQKPIPPHSTYTYSFPVIQNGTHWYHSHSGLQEQIGMYGMLILKKRAGDPTFRRGIDDLPTENLILSEWTNLNPHNVQRMLHNANDWFAIKKGSTQSYAEAIKEGHFKTKLTNEWKRMLAMDVSDIYYDAFLINGKTESQLSQYKAGDKVRLQIANGGASSYFWLNYAGGKIKVVAIDGLDIEPVEVDRLILAVSETVDIVVEIPEKNTSYELLVTPEDRTKSASVYIGEGIKQLKAPLPKLKYFEGMKMMNDMMKMNGDMKDMGMKMSYQTMDMNQVMYPEMIAENSRAMKETSPSGEMDHSRHDMATSGITTLNYGMMKSPYDTSLPKDLPVRDLKFTLTGNMNRYVWSMDDKVLAESEKILVKKGEILRITLFNNSMMRHPMHLHGFDFRVLNKNGVQAPLKNVLDVMPMETDVIEFAANTDGDWFFHCHILYHMMAGMNRVFAVGDTQNPLLPDKAAAYKKLQRESDMWHLMAENDFATNGNDGMAMVSNTRWNLTAEWRLGYSAEHGYETETHLGRYVDRMQWFMPFIGFDWRYRRMGMDGAEINMFRQQNTKNERAKFSAGFLYTLPLLINFQAEIYTDGIIRLQLMREDIPLTPRLRGAFMVNTDKEYMAGLKYIVSKNFGISTHYDSDMGWGAGLTVSY
ncbi:MAG: multicopper oxidase domain-containing protein [Kaistella sp.]|nr:multicopper oxidase domain-containing protein [Kaistella sp.]